MSSIFRVGLAVAQPRQVLDGRDQVVGPQRHFALVDVQAELPVDAEPAHAAQPVAVRVVELLVEQGLGLFQLRRIAGPQPLVDPQQGFLVAGRVVVVQGVQQQRALRLGHHLDLLQAGGANLLGGVLRDLLRALDEDLAGPRAVGRIDHVADGQLALDLRRPAAVGDLHDLGRKENAQQVGVVAVVRVHRPQERHDRELAALVDADREALLAVDVQLDPASALGNDAATMELALAGAFQLADEIDAGAAVELADDHALGPVDDKLAAAEHDGDVAEVDFLLDRLFLGQPQPDLERPAVGQAQLAAFVGLVARLAQLVPQVLQAQGLIVAFDGKDLPQHALDPLVLPLLPGHAVLQECFVAASLNFRQVGNYVRGSEAAKSTRFLGLKPSLSQGGHRGSPSSGQMKNRTPAAAIGRRATRPVPRWDATRGGAGCRPAINSRGAGCRPAITRGGTGRQPARPVAGQVGNRPGRPKIAIRGPAAGG